MPPRRRYLRAQLESDLREKMVLLSGPRQVGKTTLAQSLRGASEGYLSYDIARHREAFLRQELPSGKLWIFDEIHKYRHWRNWLKGVYDGRPPGQRVLVTGSARLDLYRFGGESLQGRYHALRLHPLSVAELGLKSNAELLELLALGGFPEPYFSGSERSARRWSREYRERLVREEVASLERFVDLGQVELLALRLPELVGSPLSLNALREDLQVAHKTIQSWVGALERLHAIYRLPPFGAPRLRALKQAQKHYHWDWTLPPSDAFRFENLVASHLLKHVQFLQDTEGLDVELRYFRDTAGREVDFVITRGRTPSMLVEVKWGDAEVSPPLRYLKERFPSAEAWQVSAVGTRDHVTADGIRVAPAHALLGTLT